MKISIIEYIINKINETGEAVDLKAVVEEIGYENYQFTDSNDMLATIYTDLMVDGRFVMVEDKWDLQEKYTIADIRAFRSMQLGTTISDYLNEDGEIIEEEEEVTPVHSTDDEDNVISVDESLSDFLSEDDLED